MMKRPLALVISIALFFAIFAAMLPHAHPYYIEETASDTGTETVEKVTELHPLPEGNAAETEHFSISTAEMAFLYHYVLTNYSQYMPMYGADPDASLKDQAYDDNQSWYDFIMESAKGTAQDTLALCESAYADGLELTQEDKDAVTESLSSLDSAAKDAGYDDTALYIESVYGYGVTREALQAYLEKSRLSAMFLQSQAVFTDEEIQAAYDKDPKAYQLIDCMFYTFQVDEENGRTAEECEKKMNELAAVTSVEDFKKLVSEDIQAQATEEEKQDLDMDAQLENLSVTGVGYQEGMEFLEKAFDGSLAVNTAIASADTENGAYSVYFLTKAPYRDESTKRNVRHILVEEHATAEDLLKQWKDGEATEDSFAALAKENSTDPGSASNGGLYEEVAPGQMVTEFNDWLFDEARKPGDTGVVDTIHGSHVMYYVGENEPNWVISVRESLQNDAFTAARDRAVDTYPCQYNDELIAQIGE